MAVYKPRYKDRKGEIKESAVWWICYQSSRKQIRESSGSTRKRDARELLNKRLGEVSQGRIVLPQRSLKLTDLAQSMLDDYRINGHRSARRARLSCKHLLEYLGDFHPREITAEVVNKYVVKQLEEGYAPATINRNLSALSRMFNLAMMYGTVAYRPHIRKLQEDNVRTGFFEPHQVDALVSHLPDYLKPVLVVAYVTGWRIKSELLTRQWSHVDFQHGWLRIEPGESKNREGRNFPFNDIPELRYALTEQRRVTEQFQIRTSSIVPWVFHREGNPTKVFRRAWNSACIKAGIPGRIPHDLRRTAIRNLERSGVPRSAAMKMVGHKTESVYRRYAIVDEGMMLESAKKLAGLHKTDRRIKDVSKTR